MKWKSEKVQKTEITWPAEKNNQLIENLHLAIVKRSLLTQD